MTELIHESESSSQTQIANILANIHRQRREAEIRLYGVLWYLVENEIISQGKALELSSKPLADLIDECIKFRNES